MTRASLAAFTTCLLLSACAEDEVPGFHSLAETEGLAVGLRISAVSGTDDAELWLTIGGAQPISLGADFGLRVNDYAAVRGPDSVISGRVLPVDLPAFPSVMMKIPAAERVAPAEVVVTDGVDEIVFALGDALLPRSATWVEPASGILVGHEEIALQWSPATDALASGLSASLYPQLQSSASLALTPDGAGLLTGMTGVLAPAADAGVGISWRTAGRVEPCFDGTCSWTVDHIVRVPTIVAPEAP